jgi:hypothetical protein
MQEDENRSAGNGMSRLLASYPRARPPLSHAVRAAYTELYLESRDGRNAVHRFSQRLEAWMHRRVGRGAVAGAPVLELGAGTLNHLSYEPAGPYDIVEPFAALYQGRPALSRVRAVYRDIGEVEAKRAYGRIISIATLEHIVNLPGCLARAGLLLRPGGVFQAGIPSEGGFLWGAAWRLSVGLMFRLKRGIDYGELMRHEHVNTAREVVDLVRYYFRVVEVQRFPTPFHHLSLYAYLEAREPLLDRCRDVAHQR